MSHCHTCTAPLEDGQRYCVTCGASRRDPSDPVARYLALRPATTVPTAVVAAPAARRPVDHRLTAIALALLPVAAAAGVLVGRAGNDSDAKLIAAIKAQKPVAAVAAAPTAAAGTADVKQDTAALTNEFKGEKGFVIELKALPAGADGTDVAKAKDAAKAHHVTAHLLLTGNYTLKPSVNSPALVYAGPYASEAAAAKALKKLKKDFPGAKVISVKKGSPAARSATAPATASSVQAEANLTDQQLTAPPSKEQKDAGAQVVQDIQSKVGKNYVDQQQQLPDTIVVP